MKFLYHKLFLYILFVTSVLTSCIRPVENVNIPNNKPKLVLVSFISPQDTIITVNVGKSYPLGSIVNERDSLKDAQVILSDGNSSISLPYDNDNNQYSVDAALFTISPGKTYHLSVSTPQGLSASASCTIPATVNTSIQIFVDSTNGQNYGSSYINYKVRYEFNDIAGQSNYYRIHALWKADYYSYPHTYALTNDNGVNFFSDLNRDGDRFSTSVYEQQIYTYNYNYLNKRIETYFMTTDKNYFEYYRSLYNYSYDDPFAEPTNVVSNVKDGLGVFAGYQMYKIMSPVL